VKFKEHSAFIDNEFKPGDFVRTYVGKTKLDFSVDKVDGDYVYWAAGGNNFEFNYRSCRLLTEEEEKTYWIKKGDAFSYGRGVMIIEPDDLEDWIEVREVFSDS